MSDKKCPYNTCISYLCISNRKIVSLETMNAPQIFIAIDRMYTHISVIHEEKKISSYELRK